LHFICHRIPAIGWNDITCAFFGLFGYLAGVPTGAALGAGVAGQVARVPGSLWGAFLGAAAGEGLAIGALALLSAIVGDNPAFQGLASLLGHFFIYVAIPVSAGFGAAWGYTWEEAAQAESAAEASSP
jgi:hypothetical protein